MDLIPEQISLAKMNNVDMALEIAECREKFTERMGFDEYPVMRHMANLESVKTYGDSDIHNLILGGTSLEFSRSPESHELSRECVPILKGPEHAQGTGILMRVAVLLKQVPDTTAKISVSGSRWMSPPLSSGRLAPMTSTMESAIAPKESGSEEVVAITCGPQGPRNALLKRQLLVRIG